ncbi:MAG: hypothetical protein U0636_13120 [Phycisphaerales bacterium]
MHVGSDAGVDPQPAPADFTLRVPWGVLGVGLAMSIASAWLFALVPLQDPESLMAFSQPWENSGRLPARPAGVMLAGSGYSAGITNGWVWEAELRTGACRVAYVQQTTQTSVRGLHAPWWSTPAWVESPPLPTRRGVVVEPSKLRPEELERGTDTAFGFPFPALALHSTTDGTQFSHWWGGAQLGTPSPPGSMQSTLVDSMPSQGRLPLQPEFLGLAGDTVIWAGAAALARAGFRRVRWVRSAVRLLTQRCGNCGHPLLDTAHGRCAECGEALAPALMQVRQRRLAWDLMWMSLVLGVCAALLAALRTESVGGAGLGGASVARWLLALPALQCAALLWRGQGMRVAQLASACASTGAALAVAAWACSNLLRMEWSSLLWLGVLVLEARALAGWPRAPQEQGARLAWMLAVGVCGASYSLMLVSMASASALREMAGVTLESWEQAVPAWCMLAAAGFGALAAATVRRALLTMRA